MTRRLNGRTERTSHQSAVSCCWSNRVNGWRLEFPFRVPGKQQRGLDCCYAIDLCGLFMETSTGTGHEPSSEKERLVDHQPIRCVCVCVCAWTHQILLTQPVKLLELLRHQELSTSHRAPDLPEDWRTETGGDAGWRHVLVRPLTPTTTTTTTLTLSNLLLSRPFFRPPSSLCAHPLSFHRYPANDVCEGLGTDMSPPQLTLRVFPLAPYFLRNTLS